MDSRSTIDRAVELHSQGRLEEAEALYRDQLRGRPADATALEGLGVIVFQKGEIDEAASLFERGLAVRPDSPRLHAYLGEALRVQKRFDLAYQHLRRRFDSRSDHGPRLERPGAPGVRPGSVSARRKRPIARRSNWRPNSAAVYNNLGNALIALHRFAEAAEVLRVALRLDPGNSAAMITLGRVLLEPGGQHSVDEAEAVCLRAVDALPRLPMAWENLGDLRRRQGRIDEALDCYQRASHLDPRRSQPYLLMGRLLRGQADFDGAARNYDQARALEPSRAICHSDICGVVARPWESRGGRAVSSHGPHIGPAACRGPSWIGARAARAGPVSGRRGELPRGARIHPELAASWASLARIQAERGEFDISCQSARVALGFDPTLPEAYCRLAANLKGRLPEHELQAIERMLDQESLGDEMRASLHFCVGAVLDARDFTSVRPRSWKRRIGYGPRPGLARADIRSRPPFAVHRCDHCPLHAGFSGEAAEIGATPTHGQYLSSACRAPARRWSSRAWPPTPRSTERASEPMRSICSNRCPSGWAIPRSTRSRQFAISTGRHCGPPPDDTSRLWRKPPHPRHRRIVNKMPDNFALLGWIALLWPGARVIVCHRDLRDIAVSCRQTDFISVEWAY